TVDSPIEPAPEAASSVPAGAAAASPPDPAEDAPSDSASGLDEPPAVAETPDEGSSGTSSARPGESSS
ncbi:MAG: hypothetical protein WAP37_08765, partial [Solirubrobacterales bacterium]